MEDALNRLDKLTQEETRMAVAENLKATHAVDERVRGVANTVVAIDNKVAGVDDRVAGVDDRVARVDDRVAHVDDKVVRVDDNVKGIDASVDQMRRSSSPNLISTDYQTLHVISEEQLRENIHKWLSPPDPSTNHNIACDTHHKKAATWFFQGSMFRKWKSAASLLWIHGKRASCSIPLLTQYLLTISRILAGSGKSILWSVHV